MEKHEGCMKLSLGLLGKFAFTSLRVYQVFNEIMFLLIKINKKNY